MSRSISFDPDLAKQVGINAAIVYNELSFWGDKGKRKDGWIYKSYGDMLDRLPLSERTVRNTYKELVNAGLIDTKLMKVDGAPTLHYRLCRMESANLAETKESANLAESSINSVSNTVSTQKIKTIELLEILNRLTGRSFRTLPNGAGRLLKTFSVEEIEKSLANLIRDPWHKDKIGELSSDYLLRSTTIDKFLTRTSSAPSRGYA